MQSRSIDLCSYCPHCLNLFSSPVMLPCGHNVCKRCAEDLADTYEREMKLASVDATEVVKRLVVCPICRKEFPAVKFLDNLELQEALNPSQKRDGVGSGGHGLICENCEKNPATKFCKNCGLSSGKDYVAFCDGCFSVVHMMKLNRGHQLLREPKTLPTQKKIGFNGALVTGGLLARSLPVCPTHHKAAYGYDEKAQKFICEECSAHECSFIEELIESCMMRTPKLKQKLRLSLETFSQEQIMEEMVSQRLEIQSQKDDLLTLVETLTSQRLQEIQKTSDALKAQIESEYQPPIEKLSLICEEIRQVSRYFEELDKKMMTLHSACNFSYIVEKNRLEEMSQTFDSMKSFWADVSGKFPPEEVEKRKQHIKTILLGRPRPDDDGIQSFDETDEPEKKHIPVPDTESGEKAIEQKPDFHEDVHPDSLSSVERGGVFNQSGVNMPGRAPLSTPEQVPPRGHAVANGFTPDVPQGYSDMDSHPADYSYGYPERLSGNVINPISSSPQSRVPLNYPYPDQYPSPRSYPSPVPKQQQQQISQPPQQQQQQIPPFVGVALVDERRQISSYPQQREADDYSLYTLDEKPVKSSPKAVPTDQYSDTQAIVDQAIALLKNIDLDDNYEMAISLLGKVASSSREARCIYEYFKLNLDGIKINKEAVRRSSSDMIYTTISLYEEAASKGSVMALFNLGNSYMFGIGVKRNLYTAKGYWARGKAMADKLDFAPFRYEFNNGNFLPLRIDLSNQMIGNDGSFGLAEAIRVNKTTVFLSVHSNGISDEGMRYLSDALKVNSSINEIWFGQNSIHDEGMGYFAECLRFNKGLTTVSMISNSIGDEGAEKLASVIDSNSTLQVLKLNRNKFTGRGIAILTSVKMKRSGVTFSTY